jgi:hypothetical protein
MALAGVVLLLSPAATGQADCPPGAYCEEVSVAPAAEPDEPAREENVDAKRHPEPEAKRRAEAGDYVVITYGEWEPDAPAPPKVNKPGGLFASMGGLYGGPTSMPSYSLSQAGPGIELMVGYELPNEWLRVGIQGAYMALGSEHVQYPYADTEVRVRTSAAMMHGVVRLQAPGWTLQPYVEGLLGFKSYASATAFKTYAGDEITCHHDDWGDEHCETEAVYDESSRSNADSVGLSAGIGVGLDLRLPVSDTFMFTVGLSARYLFGAQVEEAVTANSDDNGYVDVGLMDARSDLLIGQLALGVQF